MMNKTVTSNLGHELLNDGGYNAFSRVARAAMALKNNRIISD